jgi:hypothetical protein
MIKFNPGETRKTIYGVKNISYIKDTPPKTIPQSFSNIEEELEEKIDIIEEKIDIIEEKISKKTNKKP